MSFRHIILSAIAVLCLSVHAQGQEDYSIVDAYDFSSCYGQEFISDVFVFVDIKHHALTPYYKIEKVYPKVIAGTDGKQRITFVDRITLNLIDHENADNNAYTLRHNTLTYIVMPDGTLTLESVDKNRDDLKFFKHVIHVYDSSDSNPLSIEAFSTALNKLFPLNQIIRPIDSPK